MVWSGKQELPKGGTLEEEYYDVKLAELDDAISEMVKEKNRAIALIESGKVDLEGCPEGQILIEGIGVENWEDLSMEEKIAEVAVFYDERVRELETDYDKLVKEREKELKRTRIKEYKEALINDAVDVVKKVLDDLGIGYEIKKSQHSESVYIYVGDVSEEYMEFDKSYYVKSGEGVIIRISTHERSPLYEGLHPLDLNYVIDDEFDGDEFEEKLVTDLNELLSEIEEEEE